MAPQKIMAIRHGEKPTDKHEAPYGVTADGEQDWDSLTVRGWQRAGALHTLFDPSRGGLASPHLATPTLLYASKPRSAGETDDGSKSKRPLQTITPLAARLGLSPKLDFGKGGEAALAAQVLKSSGVVLICWQHEKIDKIARDLVGEDPVAATLPAVWPGNRFDLIWVLDPPGAPHGRWTFTQVPQSLLAGDQDTIIR
jgi:broad specificity phosphatase PhoE